MKPTFPQLPLTRRTLLLTSGAGLGAWLVGCGGGGSVTPGATPTPNPTPTPGPNPTPTPSPTPAPSGRHERFGYVERTAGGYRLASVRTDGSDYRPINMPEQPVLYQPAWSRNGQKIAYVVQDYVKNRYLLYTMNADGSDHKYYGEGLEPSWNATGTQLAYLTVHQETTPKGRSTMRFHAHNVVTNTLVFDFSDTVYALFEGQLPNSTTMYRPVWRSDAELVVSYSAVTLGEAGKEGKSEYALLSYITQTPTVQNRSTQRSILLLDAASNDGVGIVSRSIEGTSYSESEISWLSGDTLSVLKSRTRTGGGRFSPDGERLWIDLDNGKGARFYDRQLKEVGGPTNLPNSAYLSWFSEA